MNIEGKVAVVTGATGGIGAAISTALEENGAKVARLDIRAPDTPTKGLFIKCDVSDEGSWQNAIAEVEAKLGPISILYLNAGVMSRPASAPLDSDVLPIAGSEAYRRVFAVNVDGPVFGLKAALGSLKKSGDAVVVVTASTQGIEGLPIDPYYAMSKHAVVGMVRSFAPLLEPMGIKIFAICPGGVQTPIVPHDMADMAKDFLQPEELAAAALELLELEETGGIWVKDLPGKPKWKVAPATPA